MTQITHKNTDIIVVGGGMVGATTALGFAQNGFKVILLEKQQPDITWQNNKNYQTRVSALTRTSQNIFKDLGVWQKIQQKRCNTVSNMYVWEDISNAKIDFSAKEVNEENLGFVVENNVITISLWQAILENQLIEPIFNQTINQINLTKDNATIKFKSTLTLSAKLIVGADGATSTTRDLVGIKTEQYNYQQCAIVGCVKTQLSNKNTCWQRYQQTGPFAFLAMEKKISSIAWYLPIEEMPWALGLNDEQFKQQIEKASGLKLGKIKKVYQRAGFPLIRRHATNYIKPHFALVGDAAHTVHPQAGQGVNLGLLDAAALVEVITTAKNNSNKDWSRTAVLRRYERWRKGDNVIVQRAMEGFDWLFQQENPTKNKLRESFITLGNNLPIVKNWLISNTLNGRGVIPKIKP